MEKDGSFLQFFRIKCSLWKVLYQKCLVKEKPDWGNCFVPRQLISPTCFTEKKIIKIKYGWMWTWWCVRVTLALRKLVQKNCLVQSQSVSKMKGKKGWRQREGRGRNTLIINLHSTTKWSKSWDNFKVTAQTSKQTKKEKSSYMMTAFLLIESGVNQCANSESVRTCNYQWAEYRMLTHACVWEWTQGSTIK